MYAIYGASINMIDFENLFWHVVNLHLLVISKARWLNSCLFLAVQTRVWDSAIPTPVTNYKTFYFLTLKSHPRDLWPLRHLFRVMRRYDMTQKIDKDKDILRTSPKSHPRDLWPLRYLFRVMRRPDQKKDNDKYKYKDKDIDKDKYIKRTSSKNDPDTCDFSDIW